jgi:hypothetical protein
MPAKLNIEAFTLFIKCKMNLLHFSADKLLLTIFKKRFNNIAFVADAFIYE